MFGEIYIIAVAIVKAVATVAGGVAILKANAAHKRANTVGRRGH